MGLCLDTAHRGSLRDRREERTGGAVDQDTEVVPLHMAGGMVQGLYTLFGFDRVMYLNQGVLSLPNESAKDDHNSAARHRVNSHWSLCPREHGSHALHEAVQRPDHRYDGQF